MKRKFLVILVPMFFLFGMRSSAFMPRDPLSTNQADIASMMARHDEITKAYINGYQRAEVSKAASFGLASYLYACSGLLIVFAAGARWQKAVIDFKSHHQAQLSKGK